MADAITGTADINISVTSPNGSTINANASVPYTEVAYMFKDIAAQILAGGEIAGEEETQ